MLNSLATFFFFLENQIKMLLSEYFCYNISGMTAQRVIVNIPLIHCGSVKLMLKRITRRKLVKISSIEIPLAAIRSLSQPSCQLN